MMMSATGTESGRESSAAQAPFRLPLPPELTKRGTCPFDPPTALDRCAERGRVQRIDLLQGETGWLVTGYDEGRKILTDPRFSSNRLRNPQVLRRIPEHQREKFTSQDARAGVFINMDAPEHTRYRGLLTGQFTVRRMRQFSPRVREIVTCCLDAMKAKGTTAELVTDFALPVSSLVICELLGVDNRDRAWFQERTASLLNMETPLNETMQAEADLREFIRELVRAKRANPTDDLLSGLVHADTEPALTDVELVGSAYLLLIAGHETTANMLAFGTFALLEHPDQLAALRADPSLVDSAVEELLRYLSIMHIGITRTAIEDVEIGGQVIPKDSMVIVSVSEANRDPRHYDDPGKLDVTRKRPAHLAFGHGVHQCLGQQLARIEMAVGFTELLRQLPGLRLAVPADQVPLRTEMVVYGVHHLPVRWDAPA